MLIPNLSAAFFAIACVIRGLQKLHDTAELGSMPNRESRLKASASISDNLQQSLIQGENLVFCGFLLLGVPFLFGVFVDQGPVSELAVGFGHLTFVALLASGLTWLIFGVRQEFVFTRYIRDKLVHKNYCEAGHHYWLMAAKKTGSSTWKRGLIQLVSSGFLASYLHGFMPLPLYTSMQIMVIIAAAGICSTVISIKIVRSIDRVFPSTEYARGE